MDENSRVWLNVTTLCYIGAVSSSVDDQRICESGSFSPIKYSLLLHHNGHVHTTDYTKYTSWGEVQKSETLQPLVDFALT